MVRIGRAWILTVVGVFAAACGEPAALVHVSYPSEFRLVGWAVVLQGESSASINLTPGVHCLLFTKKDQEFAAVVRVQGGGEIYATLEPSDLHPVQTIEEAR